MAGVLYAFRAVGEERGRREAVPLIRLHIVVEGQTEETFVNRILAPELAPHGVFADVHMITTGRRYGRAGRGGHVNYQHLAKDLTLWMKQDRHEESWFSTMVDLHRLPGDFPGAGDMPLHVDAFERVTRLEAALAADVVRLLDGLQVASRFVPYVQLHEFEALLFADPSAFVEAFPDRPDLIDKLAAIRQQFGSPEHINDGPDTAPSKRIGEIYPQYGREKAVAAPLVAARIGLARIRQECPHFNHWVERLIATAAAPGS